MIQDGKAVLQIPNKADLSLLLGTSQNPRQYRRLGAQTGVYPAANGT